MQTAPRLQSDVWVSGGDQGNICSEAAMGLNNATQAKLPTNSAEAARGLCRWPGVAGTGGPSHHEGNGSKEQENSHLEAGALSGQKMLQGRGKATWPRDWLGGLRRSLTPRAGRQGTSSVLSTGVIAHPRESQEGVGNTDHTATLWQASSAHYLKKRITEQIHT